MQMRGGDVRTAFQWSPVADGRARLPDGDNNHGAAIAIVASPSTHRLTRRYAVLLPLLNYLGERIVVLDEMKHAIIVFKNGIVLVVFQSELRGMRCNVTPTAHGKQ